MRRVTHSEDGSIAPLILAYFSLVMTAIFLISNIASVYIARRELINVTEAALSRAAQELDEFVYYYRVPISELSGNNNQRVPINCSEASVTLRRELGIASRGETRGVNSDRTWGMNKEHAVSNQNPEITYFGCNGTVLRAKVRQEHLLPFALNVFGIRSYVNEISVSVEARFS